MNVTCQSCSALHFSAERAGKQRNVFLQCCHNGKVKLQESGNHSPLYSHSLFISFSSFVSYVYHLDVAFPDAIRSLFVDDTAVAKEFRQHIRPYNNALAMASLGAQLDTPRGTGSYCLKIHGQIYHRIAGPYCFKIHGQIYHRIGDLHPQPGAPRKFGQLYILDSGFFDR